MSSLPSSSTFSCSIRVLVNYHPPLSSKKKSHGASSSPFSLFLLLPLSPSFLFIMLNDIQGKEEGSPPPLSIALQQSVCPAKKEKRKVGRIFLKKKERQKPAPPPHATHGATLVQIFAALCHLSFSSSSSSCTRRRNAGAGGAHTWATQAQGSVV